MTKKDEKKEKLLKKYASLGQTGGQAVACEWGRVLEAETGCVWQVENQRA